MFLVCVCGHVLGLSMCLHVYSCWDCVCVCVCALTHGCVSVHVLDVWVYVLGLCVYACMCSCWIVCVCVLTCVCPMLDAAVRAC